MGLSKQETKHGRMRGWEDGDGRWEMRSMQDRDGKFNLNFEYYIRYLITRRVEAVMMQEVKIEVLNLKVQNKYFCT